MGLTAWRKKSTLIAAIILGIVLILCLQYIYTEHKRDVFSGLEAEALVDGNNNNGKVQFLGSHVKARSSSSKSAGSCLHCSARLFIYSFFHFSFLIRTCTKY